eukprot:3583945-Pyramimonas_sp.AAC.1
MLSRCTRTVVEYQPVVHQVLPGAGVGDVAEGHPVRVVAALPGAVQQRPRALLRRRIDDGLAREALPRADGGVGGQVERRVEREHALRARLADGHHHVHVGPAGGHAVAEAVARRDHERPRFAHRRVVQARAKGGGPRPAGVGGLDDDGVGRPVDVRADVELAVVKLELLPAVRDAHRVRPDPVQPEPHLVLAVRAPHVHRPDQPAHALVGGGGAREGGGAILGVAVRVLRPGGLLAVGVPRRSVVTLVVDGRELARDVLRQPREGVRRGRLLVPGGPSLPRGRGIR